MGYAFCLPCYKNIPQQDSFSGFFNESQFGDGGATFDISYNTILKKGNITDSSSISSYNGVIDERQVINKRIPGTGYTAQGSSFTLSSFPISDYSSFSSVANSIKPLATSPFQSISFNIAASIGFKLNSSGYWAGLNIPQEIDNTDEFEVNYYIPSNNLGSYSFRYNPSDYSYYIDDCSTMKAKVRWRIKYKGTGWRLTSATSSNYTQPSIDETQKVFFDNAFVVTLYLTNAVGVIRIYDNGTGSNHGVTSWSFISAGEIPLFDAYFSGDNS